MGLFSSDFKKAVKECAEANEWEIKEISKEQAILEFQAESGNLHTLYATSYDDTVEFSVTSAAIFDSEEDVPGEVSTQLLKRNTQVPLGFWCLEELEEGCCYSIMCNVALEEMDADLFAEIADAMVAECDEFDGIWEGLEEEE